MLRLVIVRTQSGSAAAPSQALTFHSLLTPPSFPLTGFKSSLEIFFQDSVDVRLIKVQDSLS